jgi:hypothetical protein
MSESIWDNSSNFEKNSPSVVVKNGRELRLKHVQNIVLKISNETIDPAVPSN